MNTTMADGASERLDAQIADALFGQPGMSKLDVANLLRGLRGEGSPLLADAGSPVSPSPVGLVGISAEWVLGYLATDAPEKSRDAIRNAFAEYAALSAARHPVGEPVAWMTHHDEPMLFPTAAEAAAYCEDDEQPVPLIRSPAQAVDLGKLARYEPIGSDGMNMERVADGRWVKLADLGSLIDSKAVHP